ncbi:MAG: hypothetical protein QGF00_09555 [Planctomycetota bacterium]|jgi:DNA-binding NtrC family response regulator|nr:hypothetical protein [Planctomycetota bacterium]MDP7249833.1 hypothetical protein [Planctomycetota bacterium]
MSHEILQDKRALLIDRDLDSLNILDGVLPEFGYEIAITQSADEALVRLEMEEFQLTVVDLSVSQIPPEDFISKIHERAPELPIVGLAANLDSRGRFFPA